MTYDRNVNYELVIELHLEQPLRDQMLYNRTTHRVQEIIKQNDLQVSYEGRHTKNKGRHNNNGLFLTAPKLSQLQTLVDHLREYQREHVGDPKRSIPSFVPHMRTTPRGSGHHERPSLGHLVADAIDINPLVDSNANLPTYREAKEEFGKE